MSMRKKISNAMGIIDERESQLRLQTSVRLRWLAVLGQLAAVGIITGVYGFGMPVGSCLTLIALSAWLNVFLAIRFPARHRLSTAFATSLLLYDMIQLAGLLYLTGGIENPFMVLMLAPVTVSAATLPLRSTLLLGLAMSVLGAVLITEHYPLPWYEGQHFDMPRIYKVGAYTALLASTVFTAFYTWRISAEARQMSAALAATDMVLASEQRLHALDGLAAAAAHELGTPLSTIVLVSKELQRELGPGSQHDEDLELLRSQAQRCREILQKLTRSPDEQDPMHTNISVREIIDEASRAHTTGAKSFVVTAGPVPGSEGPGTPEPVGERRPGVIYGLGNIIENAVDFAVATVSIDARWNRALVTVTITDDGPGFPAELMDTIGEPYVTTRRLEDEGEEGHSGLGLGFFIAKTLLERSGATVGFSNQPEPKSGAIVEVTWTRAAFEARVMVPSAPAGADPGPGMD
jgi:two-component system, sensor histidine kinase RegB